MRNSTSTQRINLGLLFLAVIVVSMLVALRLQSNVAMDASTASTPISASLEPTDPISLLPLSSATADAATLHAISIQVMTSEPPDPRSLPGGLETWNAQRATGFAAQSTYVAAYNRTVEKFMTHYVQTPNGMRTPVKPTFITMSPPVDYSKITPIIITLGPPPTHTPTPSPTQ